jgi:hypothetical protein
LKEIMKEKLEEKFSFLKRMKNWRKDIKNIEEEDRSLLLAASIDPGAWKSGFFDILKCTNSVKELLEGQLSNIPETNPVDEPHQVNIWTRVKDKKKEKTSPSNNKNVIRKYISAAIVWNGTAVDFWRANISNLGSFLPLIRRYLCFSASSASVERLFSTCGDLVSKKRNRLTPQHVEILIFLKYFKIANEKKGPVSEEKSPKRRRRN